MSTQDTIKVLVPVDFSETSRCALAWAFDYATRAPCDVHLLHVVEDKLSDMVSERSRERYQAELEGIAREAAEELKRIVPDPDDRKGIGKITQHVARGNPASEILRVAEKLGAELIVVGSHGRGGLSGLLIGSVAEKIVRHAHCPVVCVKPGRK
jgi:nucleotide-binding universal stress UspA family protein